MEDLEALRQKARDANHWGPWAIWHDLKDEGFVHVGNADGVIPEEEIATAEDAEPNPIAKCYTPEIAEFIAAANPDAVIALLDRLEVAERERDVLGKAAFAAVVASGEDTDGAETWESYFRPMIHPSWVDAVHQNVTSLREERDQSDIEALTAEAKIARVRELHQPFEWSFGYGPVKSCKACADQGLSQESASWPCPTIRALDGEEGS